MPKDDRRYSIAYSRQKSTTPNFISRRKDWNLVLYMKEVKNSSQSLVAVRLLCYARFFSRRIVDSPLASRLMSSGSSPRAS